MSYTKTIEFSDKIYLKSDYGPVAFGLVTSLSLIALKDKSRKDLLFYRLGDGYYSYPVKSLDDSEFANEPVKIAMPDNPYLPYEEVSVPVDWDRDGVDDLIAVCMTGFMYYLKRHGNYPDIGFTLAGPLTDRKTNLLFNIPYENPNHPVMNNLNGYFDTAFFNYPAPCVYPAEGSDKTDLIIGDWAGNLWWLPDLGDGSTPPLYEGEKYIKDKADIVSRKGKILIERFGCEYVKPKDKICDENNRPFLLGEGYDTGAIFEGAVTRPVLYYNKKTGSNDLIVLAGTRNQIAYYLEYTGTDRTNKPVFRNLGSITFTGSTKFDNTFNMTMNMHTKIALYDYEGENKLVMTSNNHVAVYNEKSSSSLKPEFVFERVISGSDVTTAGYNFTEILSDINNRRYLLDNPNHLELRELLIKDEKVMLSSKKHPIFDQHGIFTPEGETDPQLGKDWGFHRASLWDYDNSGRLHLIVATDKGELFLLIEDKPLGSQNKFIYRSCGPLKDTAGNVIKIHNRASAAAIDLDHDGRDDLIVGGVTYQLGSVTDPNPGGGFYYLLNKGIDDEGIPILEKALPLQINGHRFNIKVNTHVNVKTIKLPRSDKRSIILCEQADGFVGHVFTVSKDNIALDNTGIKISRLSTEENLLDIDDDGQFELVFGGGEEGAAFFKKQPIV